ncbi:hypothetical protein PN462_07435 [Spirulina sp. CS-785/01]|uniref:hypothetical protein n=1 Tax=Spirulina sp. CS-785/01 TaxID=3021716 RepID=UPI00232B59B9|nr:hypothetical protein [Spirulina sp. CS-785/01]MDB9312928.1 hypothetical protein [Spirulina sp. CS-785/01]
MKKLWFTSRSTTAALCLVGIFAHTAHALEAGLRNSNHSPQPGSVSDETATRSDFSNPDLDPENTPTPENSPTTGEFSPVEPSTTTTWNQTLSLPPDTPQSRSEYPEDDPVFQAVLEPDKNSAQREAVTNLSSEELIRDERSLHELVNPDREEQQARTAGLPPEELPAVRQVEQQELSRRLQAARAQQGVTPDTPMLRRLEADLNQLRQEADRIAAQNNKPLPTPDLGVIENQPQPPAVAEPTPDQELEAAIAAWEAELTASQPTPLNPVVVQLNAQLFSQDLTQLGIKTFETHLATTPKPLQSLFTEPTPDTPPELQPITQISTGFESLLQSWQMAVAPITPEHDPQIMLNPAFLEFIDLEQPLEPQFVNPFAFGFSKSPLFS